MSCRCTVTAIAMEHCVCHVENQLFENTNQVVVIMWYMCVCVCMYTCTYVCLSVCLSCLSG